MARNTSGEQYAASKYIELPVRKESTLMVFLMEQMSGTSRNRVKDLLAGHAVTVDRKLVTRFDYPLQEGMMVRVTRHKRSSELNSKVVKIIYEDKDLAAETGGLRNFTDVVRVGSFALLPEKMVVSV